jgi:hypothetical protein
MRNIIEHLKGDFFTITLKAVGKQKVKWKDFADTLAIGGQGSAEHSKLIAEELTHKAIHSTLTIVAKNLSSLAAADLRNAFTQAMDHLFSLLFLTDSAVVQKYI